MNMKNGFSTLNRLLGKKSSKANGSFNGNHLSKSTTNLSLSTSTTNINEASQMQYNRITPLPVATSNAPFEQTFRITVLLPKEQLYVARLGARVPLQKLLELVCENKQLDPEKYEFRHPVDSSQVFNCALTIGAVGLSEIRLCNKSESYDSFNADDIITLHRTSIIRDSLSSSEFSSRNSKQTAKTASPYSSSNSLNSMDSTGMNYNRTPVQVPQAAKFISPAAAVSAQPPIAPTRKKRMAPKPPSHISIPEKSPLITTTTTTNGGYDDVADKKMDARQPLPRKEFHVSSPNLYRTSSTELSLSVVAAAAASNARNDVESIVDCNGNTESKRDHNRINGKHEIVVKSLNKSPPAPRTRPLSVHVFNQQDQLANHQHHHNNNNNQNNHNNNRQQTTSRNQLEEKNNIRNMYSGSVQSLSSFDENKFPEPSPRKHILLVKKKVAPSPPPRTVAATTATTELAAAAKVDLPNSQSSLRWPMLSAEQLPDGEKSSEMQLSSVGHQSITSLVEKEQEQEQQQQQNHQHQTDSAMEASPPTPIEPAMRQTTNPLPIQEKIVQETIASETPTPASTPTSPHSGTTTSPNGKLNITTGGSQIEAQTPPVPVAMPRVPPQKIETSTVETATADHHRTINNNNNNNNNSTTNKNNVSKVLLNRTLTPEPPPPPSPPSPPSPPNPVADQQIVEIVEIVDTEIETDRSPSPPDATSVANTTDVIIYRTHSDDNLSKQADSGIGEPIPSPIPEESLTSENSTAECKSSFESGSSSSSSSSDDDEMIKVYNLKLGKTIIKSMSEHKSFEDLPVAVAVEEEGGKVEEKKVGEEISMNGSCDPTSPSHSTSSWNYTIPAPPNFADIAREKDQSATSIEENPIEVRPTVAPPSTLITTSVMVAAKVVDELNAIINENRIDSIIRKSEDATNRQQQQIESAKPNTLKNFTINAIAIGQPPTQPNGLERKTPPANDDDDPMMNDDEKLFRKRGNLLLTTNGLFKHRKSITRSDSFHSTCLPEVTPTGATATTNGGCNGGGGGVFPNSNGLNSRSSSYISLAKHEMSSIQGGLGTIVSNSRRSSSELSIGESPGLQSLLVMKSILNSRKNSLNNGECGHIVQSNGCNENSDKQTTDMNGGADEQEKAPSAAPPQPPPKVYRYSGPPSINFSTWSERPKGQISIKNEGDYIFGGGNNGSHNAVTTAALNFTTTARNGTGRNSSMSSSSSSSSASATSPPSDSVPTRILPFVRSVEYKKNAGGISTSSSSIPTMKRFSMGATMTAPQTENESGDLKKPISNKFILGRLGGNLAKPPSMANGGYGIVPSVRGFRNTGDFSLPQQQQPQQQQQQQQIEVTPQTNGHHFLSGNFEQQTSKQHLQQHQQLPNGNEQKTLQSTLPRMNASNRFSIITPGSAAGTGAGGGAGLLRSTSITQYDAKSKKSTTTDPVPFSQLQLRKTGLKEKILATSCGDDNEDAAAAAAAKESSASVQETANKIRSVSVIEAADQEQLDSAKKEQKSSCIQIVSPIGSPPTTPPAPPIIRAVLAKQNSNGMPPGSPLPSPPPDTREQLLAAIRNFKRTDLNRA